MSELPTVEIVNPASPSGFTRINESDFDPTVHRRFGESRGEPSEAVPEDPNTPERKKRGRPFKVV
jgi:hypothetical protein